MVTQPVPGFSSTDKFFTAEPLKVELYLMNSIIRFHFQRSINNSHTNFYTVVNIIQFVSQSHLFENIENIQTWQHLNSNCSYFFMCIKLCFSIIPLEKMYFITVLRLIFII